MRAAHHKYRNGQQRMILILSDPFLNPIKDEVVEVFVAMRAVTLCDL
jgi:hypothetical protein